LEIFETLIIGSDRRTESKQGKIVMFESCLRHFRFTISCAVVNAAILTIWHTFKSRYTETWSDLTFVHECTG